MKINKKRKGIALVYALMLVLAFSTLLALGTRSVLNSLELSSRELRDTQATNVARSGIQDAFGWFSRQTNIVKFTAPCTIGDYGVGNYPDLAFAPIQRTTSTDIADSDYSQIGIVRDIVLDSSNNIYGHYEVKKQLKNTCLNSSGVAIPISTLFNDNKIYDTLATHDITQFKRFTNLNSIGGGLVWRVVSTGYVYKRVDETKDPTTGVFTVRCCNPKDNELSTATSWTTDQINDFNNPAKKPIVYSKKVLSAEINRLNIDVPENAISINSAANLICTDTRSIVAPGSNNAVAAISGAVSAGFKAVIRTSVAALKNATMVTDLSVEKIFGMTRDVLKGVSDFSNSSASGFGGKSNRYNGKLIFIDGNAQFTTSNPLKGSGILFVKGNLTFDSDAQTFFSGVIYVENGNVIINSGNTLSGSIVVAGTGKSLTLNSSTTGDVATLEYNSGVITSMRKKLANYRINRLSYKAIGG